jgi:hypothetical protein
MYIQMHVPILNSAWHQVEVAHIHQKQKSIMVKPTMFPKSKTKLFWIEPIYRNAKCTINIDI